MDYFGRLCTSLAFVIILQDLAAAGPVHSVDPLPAAPFNPLQDPPFDALKDRPFTNPLQVPPFSPLEERITSVSTDRLSLDFLMNLLYAFELRLTDRLYCLLYSDSIQTDSILNKTSLDIPWRDDLRCGPRFPLADGRPAECDPNGVYPCCAPSGWCGYTRDHCDCGDCIDYRKTVGLPNFHQAIVCGNEKQTISCDKDGAIETVAANYGRTSEYVCPWVCPWDQNTCAHNTYKSILDTNCHSENSLAKVESLCNGKNSCELWASNSIFGEPCHGTYKYLDVHYRCTDSPSRRLSSFEETFHEAEAFPFPANKITDEPEFDFALAPDLEPEPKLVSDVSMETALPKEDPSGYESLEITEIHSESICFGELSWIHDGFTHGNWAEDGFGDCSEEADGWVRLTLADTKYVSYVAIHTPSTGHSSNDFYQVEVCENPKGGHLNYENCNKCGPVPRTAPGHWSWVTCKLVGNEVALTKRVATNFQLIEVEVFGSDTATIPESKQAARRLTDYRLGIEDGHRGWY